MRPIVKLKSVKEIEKIYASDPTLMDKNSYNSFIDYVKVRLSSNDKQRFIVESYKPTLSDLKVEIKCGQSIYLIPKEFVEWEDDSNIKKIAIKLPLNTVLKDVVVSNNMDKEDENSLIVTLILDSLS